MLTEMEQVTGLHRKSLLRLLPRPVGSARSAQRRATIYGIEVEQVMLRVWESLDYVCAERLTPVLLPTAQHLARFGVVHLTEQLEEQVGQISEATVTRILRQHRSHKRCLPRHGPERANRVTQGCADGTHRLADQ